MSSSFISKSPRPSCICNSSRGSKPPQLELNLGSISPLRILSGYAFEDFENHCEHDMAPSDESESLSSFETSSSTCSSPSLNGSSEHLTITLQSLVDGGDDEAGFRKDTRPLPPVPTSASTVCPTPTISPRTRPLPPTPHLKTEDVAISVTLATPLSSPIPPTSSPNHLSPPRVRRLPTPFISPSIPRQPSCDTVSTSDCHCLTVDSPPSPTLTIEGLSPEAVIHRRLSKLRRYLGETVPHDLVPVISSARDPRAARDLLVRLSSFSGSANTIHEPALDPVVISRKLKELEADKSLSDDEDEDIVFVEAESPVEGSESWSAGGDISFRATPLHRYSKKWVWEKKGRRREEQDYAYILRALRSL
ncbi:hypothetical protein EV359DRAFT_76637 [Lentinula novae-zelandiae]|nr:hypothetical protein EV359DRAFT_76637 [Lentinula novae-zelandiae]